jgi:hypothetical protein
MLTLRGIKPASVDLSFLVAIINECTKHRNMLAHSVWCLYERKFCIQLTKDSYDVIDNDVKQINRAITPQLGFIADSFFKDLASLIEIATRSVTTLNEEVARSPGLLPLLQTRGLRDATGSRPATA